MNKQSLLLAVLCLLLMKIIWYLVLDLVMVSLSLSLWLHFLYTDVLQFSWVGYWFLSCFLLIASTHDKYVFSFYPDNRPCNDLEEAIARYREIVPHLKLSGSTQPSFLLAYFKARFSSFFCPFEHDIHSFSNIIFNSSLSC
jgi:hypothetical protein